MDERKRGARGGARTPIEWEQYDKLLGTMTDLELAGLVGCSEGAVNRRRRRLGVEAHQPHMARGFFDWDRADHLLGKLTDASVARVMGVGPSAVCRRRRILGIPAPPRSAALSDLEALWDIATAARRLVEVGGMKDEADLHAALGAFFGKGGGR